jgi:hypothetical protein
MVKHMGLPSVMVSDRDSCFVLTFWTSLAWQFDTWLAMSTAAHPQMDGQTEIMNQQLKVMLCAYVNKDRNDWDHYLDVLMLAYNNNCHSAMGETLAMLLMGYQLCVPSTLLLQEGSLNVRAEERIQALNECRNSAREAICLAQEKQSKAYNMHHKLVTYKVGDKVLINPHKLNLLEVKGEGRKLMQRHIGPFEVIEKVNDNTYKLRLPDSYPMHNVVNISHLRPYCTPVDEN